MSGSFYTRGNAQGQGTFQPSPLVFIPDVPHDPTTNDINYPTCQLWFNPTSLNLWYLSSKSSSSGTIQATWVLLSSGVGGSFKQITTATDSGVVFPNPPNGNVTFESTANTLAITNPAPFTVNYDLPGGKFAVQQIAMQTGTSPVVATSTGLVTFNGATVAAGTNPVRTDGTGPNTMQLEVQTSQAIASTDATKIGLSAFNSADFSVDANGFVSVIAGAFKWSDQSVSFNALAENGYFIVGNLTATLPASPSNGDTIKFFVDGSNTLTIQANTGQTIKFATNVSSSAGTQSNTHFGDSCELVYRSSNTRWCATSFVGAWNFT